jgi:DNA-binding response OmpR family regulator
MNPAPIVLVADRSILVSNYLKRKLVTTGYTLLHAKDGHEALAVLNRESHIAVAVVELELPAVNGLDVIGKLTGKQPKPTTIIATTFLKDALLLELATHLGADKIVRKPARKRLLIEIVKPLLRNLWMAAQPEI